jgi:hypothetical protein
MDCNKKVSNTCGTNQYAPCVFYELDLPDFSLIEDDCVTIEDTTSDVYALISDIREQLDLSDLGEDCLTYALDSNSKIVVKNVLAKIEEKYCELEEKVNNLTETGLCNISISECNLNLGTLTDNCDVQPSTLKALLQLLIDQHQI